jgi:hypothetical protein
MAQFSSDAPPIVPEPADAPFDFPELVDALGALGPADMSANEAAMRQPGSTMLTSAGSPNDLFWSKLETVDAARVVTPDGMPPLPGMRAFQFTEGGARAIAIAFRVLLARKAGGLPEPDAEAAAFMAPAVEKRTQRLERRKKTAEAIAYLETIEPKTAERQAKKAELRRDSQTFLRFLDAAIGAINDAVATGPNQLALGFGKRSQLFRRSG